MPAGLFLGFKGCGVWADAFASKLCSYRIASFTCLVDDSILQEQSLLANRPQKPASPLSLKHQGSR